MDGILFVLFLIWLIGRMRKNYKKVTKNAPSSSNKQPLITFHWEDVEKADERPAVHPVAPSNEESCSEPVPSAEAAAAVFDECGLLDESDCTPTPQEEGESRLCNHGSLGGSMEAADHQGLGEAFVHAQQQVKTRVETTVKTQVHLSREDDEALLDEETGAQTNGSSLFPAGVTAEQMRRAVVMAEILKRPSERMRRWNPR